MNKCSIILNGEIVGGGSSDAKEIKYRETNVEDALDELQTKEIPYATWQTMTDEEKSAIEHAIVPDYPEILTVAEVNEKVDELNSTLEPVNINDWFSYDSSIVPIKAIKIGNIVKLTGTVLKKTTATIILRTQSGYEFFDNFDSYALNYSQWDSKDNQSFTGITTTNKNTISINNASLPYSYVRFDLIIPIHKIL